MTVTRAWRKAKGRTARSEASPGGEFDPRESVPLLSGSPEQGQSPPLVPVRRPTGDVRRGCTLEIEKRRGSMNQGEEKMVTSQTNALQLGASTRGKSKRQSNSKG